ncbi:amino acid ABC transporter substrate-binding protein [Oxalobacteraceae bacterium]|nr:amino acid ABC transporter substrate-binding protein [Oxalobacteraceae bacterium]
MNMLKVLVLAGAVAATMANANANDAAGKLTNADGVVTIGYREASVPFSYLDGQKKPVGYTMDLCAHIVDAIRKQPGMADLKVNYVAVSSSDRMEKVKGGAVDLECGSTTVTKQRAGEVAFSNPIFFADTKILVRADSGIRTIADLKEKRVIVNQGATGAPLLAKVDMDKGLHIQFVKSRDNVESFKSLQQSKVDAFVHDDIQLTILAATSSDPKGYTLLAESLSSDPIAIMVRKDNKQLKQLVDATLAKINASGELAKVYAKWFMTPTFKVPMGDALKNELKRQ